MKVRGLRVLASLFIVSALLLSAFLATAFAGAVGERVPEFPVAQEVITGTALLAAFLALRRRNK
ncbi:MAG: hypothetical protein FGF50_10300 [Candidatus Brockarchaeota archaeon]|nr:hypothetical protein [Candidatus Brockarchaeota archaeon]